MPPQSTSKRHSLTVTIGPRPLHLVDGNIPLSSTVTTQLPSPPPNFNMSSPFPKPNVRRHSSISYRFSDHVTELPPLSISLQPHSTNPAMTSSSHVKEHGERERPPLTLVEKHSDLLHFIAQKESKCLELRSQLVNLEAEIIQLKRKWERIVNRGFLDNPPSSVSPSQGNGAVFEGIVEGMQGVGRFIAAGLAIGEQKPPSPYLTSLPRPLPHSYFPSSSTCGTKSSPLSRSSTSSITEGSAIVRATNDQADGEPAQILMVHDTGATPTMSPNPAFEHQRQQRQQRGQHDLEPDLEVPLLRSPKLPRKKSRDVQPRTLVPREGPSTTLSQLESTLEAAEKTKEEMRMKTVTVHGTSFPPVSSIPGLAALTVGPVSPVPSFVESVGKKWDELQRSSTFSKNQKRASVLLADVSQSIKSVLSSPTSQSSPPPSYFNPSGVESNFSLNKSSVACLNNNHNTFVPQRTIFGPIQDSNWQSLGSTSPSGIDLIDENTRPESKGEDEWNW